MSSVISKQTGSEDILKIVSFNVHGLYSRRRTENEALMQNLLESSIFILSETHVGEERWLEEKPEKHFKNNFHIHFVPAHKEMRSGRGIGGFIFGVSKHLANKGIQHEFKKIKEVEVIELNIKGAVQTSIIIVPVYIRNDNWCRNFIEQVVQIFPRQNCIIIGDSNIRIGELQQRVGEQHIVEQPLQAERKSQDKTTNSYGHRYLNFCNTCNLIVLNGQCKGDLQGAFTYESTCGKSVNDICAISRNLIKYVKSFCVGENNYKSDHFPINLSLNMSAIIDLLKQPSSRMMQEQLLFNNQHVQVLVDIIKKSLAEGKSLFCCFVKFLNSAEISKEIIDFINVKSAIATAYLGYQQFEQSLQRELILIATTADKLQKYITELYDKVCKSKLKLDFNKSEILIFRKGGRGVGNNVKFYFSNTQKIAICKEHVYEGYVLTVTLSSLICNNVNLLTLQDDNGSMPRIIRQRSPRRNTTSPTMSLPENENSNQLTTTTTAVQPVPSANSSSIATENNLNMLINYIKQALNEKRRIYCFFIKFHKNPLDIPNEILNFLNEITANAGLQQIEEFLMFHHEIQELQNLINQLRDYCKKYKLQILKSSQIMVFRNGGIVAKSESWSLNKKKIPITSEYTYQNTTLTPRLAFVK